MAARKRSRIPRPAPPGVGDPQWESEVPGVGTFYCLGAAFRNGTRNYLIRLLVDGEEPTRSIVAAVEPDGRVSSWYLGWDRRAESEPAVAAAIAEASRFAITHSVMSG